MVLPTPRHGYTFAEYLALEQASNVKHEYFNGEIYAMAGGTPAHAALAVAVSSSLFAQLRGGPCRVFSSDLRIRVAASGLCTYPDVTVVCGPLEPDPESGVTVINPSVIVEVTSDSTESYDRGEKLEHYQQVASLKAVLVLSHREARLDLWQRDPGGQWVAERFGPGQTAQIATPPCSLDVNEIYAAGQVG
jgi:Uma2 family endonuclease